MGLPCLHTYTFADRDEDQNRRNFQLVNVSRSYQFFHNALSSIVIYPWVEASQTMLPVFFPEKDRSGRCFFLLYKCSKSKITNKNITNFLTCEGQHPACPSLIKVKRCVCTGCGSAYLLAFLLSTAY
jgi:hypothetical protein